MAVYPAFFTLASSTLVADNGMQPERATNGALKLRRLWPADKAVAELGHLLTAAQKATLDAFYTANKDLDVTYTWPAAAGGGTYTMRFLEPPRYTPRGAFFEARVRLGEA